MQPIIISKMKVIITELDDHRINLNQVDLYVRVFADEFSGAHAAAAAYEKNSFRFGVENFRELK